MSQQSTLLADASPVAAAARTQLERGYMPVLIYPREKRPVGGGWQNVRYTAADDLETVFTPAHNIGLNIGASNLVDADLDSIWARKLAPAFLPPSTMVWGRRSAPASHWAYRPVGDVPYKKYVGVVGANEHEKLLLERRAGDGKQSVIPPSIHKDTGEPIAWVQPGPASDVDAKELCWAFDRLAAASLLASIWKETTRHTIALAIAGVLAKAKADEDLVRELFEAVADVTNDDEVADRIKAIETTYALYHADPKRVAGYKELLALLPEDAKDITSKLTEWLQLAPGADSDRPVIVTSDRDWAEIVEDGYRALVGSNGDAPELFQQSGRLVRIRLDEEGKPRVDTLSDAALKGTLVHTAQWLSLATDAAKPVQPPDFVVQYILAKKAWLGLPPLRGVVEAPVVTRDGQVVLGRGYQPATRLWFHLEPGFSIPAVVDAPSRDEVGAATRVILDDVLVDFPFHDDASRAHAVALLLLPFVRELINGPTPLHLVDAPTPGTGKGLLVDVAALIATGRVPKKVSQPRDDEEWRKRITSQLVRGTGMIVIDNVAARLDSGALASVLTATEWEDRKLGVNKVIEAPNRSVWVATGNNVTMSNEIARRVAWIRLTPKEEKPWERTVFKHANLGAWVQAHRGALIHACLTLAKAWVAASRPDGKAPRLGSFEDWAYALGGILAVAGVPGFLGNHAELYEQADAELAPWREFVEVWAERHGTKTVRVDELYTLANQGGGLLAEALGDDRASDRARQTKLGIGLRKYRDRVIAGHRIRVTDAKHRAAYRLEPAT